MIDASLINAKYTKSKNIQKAFTLVELMVVVAIISILISIALPSYQAVTQKGQRTEGQVFLLEIQSYLERYYFNNHVYPDSLSKLNVFHADQVDSENAYYQVMLESDQSCSTNSCFLLTAKHVSGEETETLSLHSSGDRKGPW